MGFKFAPTDCHSSLWMSSCSSSVPTTRIVCLNPNHALKHAFRFLEQESLFWIANYTTLLDAFDSENIAQMTSQLQVKINHYFFSVEKNIATNRNKPAFTNPSAKQWETLLVSANSQGQLLVI